MIRIFSRVRSLVPFRPKQIDVDGVKILLRGLPLTQRIRRRLITRGLYETAERELIKAFIRPRDQILEIGASAGIVTSFLANAAGESGRIVSIEADSSIRPHFERQLALNGKRADLINALCCPVWNQPVPEELRSLKFKPSDNNLIGRTANPGEGGIEVRWITAETACLESRLEPTAVVVDVEGTEAVWVGHSPQFPGSVRTIILDLEVDPGVAGARRAAGVVQSVIEEGFRVVGIRSNVYAFEKR